LGKMLARFHWEQGRLLWERLRSPEAQTVQKNPWNNKTALKGSSQRFDK